MSFMKTLAQRAEERKLAVWNKGTVIDGFDAAEWRHDDAGNPISFAAYGDRTSEHGWEIDHILPVDAGGSDDLTNLRPLQWAANVARN